MEFNNETEEVASLDRIQNPELREKLEKTYVVLDKAELVFKRVILGIIITVLTIIIGFQTVIVYQTMKAKNYVETTATMIAETQDEDFNGAKYRYEDKSGNEHKTDLVAFSSKMDIPQEIVIYYNPNNPEDFYDEAALMNGTEWTWYIVQIIIVGLLILLFFNKKLLSKINIRIGK